MGLIKNVARKKNKVYSRTGAYFRHVLNLEFVQKEIIKIRKKLDIPVDGIIDNLPADVNSPSLYHNINLLMGYKNGEKLWSLSEKVLLKYGLGEDIRWVGLMVEYVAFNIKPNFSSDEFYSNQDLISIQNICADELSDDDFREYFDKEVMNGRLLYDKKFPVALRISAYASKRDILEYIAKNFKKIETLLNRYKDKRSKLGKVVFKKNADRDEFIFEKYKEGRSFDEIQALVLMNWQDNSVDIGEIRKIVSVENIRRKLA